MLNKAVLDGLVGKTIGEFCAHGYDAKNDNHCAHFVSHVLNLNVGMTCGRLVPTPDPKAAAASVRVHEIFDASRNVRQLVQCPLRGEGLVFVSAATNFVRQGTTTALRNVPKKHIGLFLGNDVWHYSNSRDRVVRQSAEEFLTHYPKQTNAIWLADIPATARPFQSLVR